VGSGIVDVVGRKKFRLRSQEGRLVHAVQPFLKWTIVPCPLWRASTPFQAMVLGSKKLPHVISHIDHISLRSFYSTSIHLNDYWLGSVVATNGDEAILASFSKVPPI
jgi:hypothetical protein